MRNTVPSKILKGRKMKKEKIVESGEVVGLS